MPNKLLIILLVTLSLTAFAQIDNKQLAQQITAEADAVDAALPQINALTKKGEKAQARAMVEKALQQIDKIETELKQLAQTDGAVVEEVPSLVQIQETRQYLLNKANQLRYTCIYLQCDAKLFDSDYTALKDDLLTALSDENVSFVESAGASDWSITVTAKAREYNKADFGGVSSYIVYVDAKAVIEKAATGKRVLDKTVTEKGGSPFGFEQAAQEAYQSVAPKVSDLIKEQIAQ